jgi:hypothetical protein
MKTKTCIALCVIGVIVTFSLTFFVPTQEVSAAPAQAVALPQIIDYGEGVYWFPWTGGQYMNKLAQFRKSHLELEFVGATGEIGSSQMGHVGTYGYTVYFRKK